MAKFIHTADLHIRGERPDRIDILENIMEVAKSLGADGLIISGDLFDKKGYSQSVRLAVRAVFEKYGDINVFVIPGECDYEYYPNDFGYNVKVLAEYPVSVTKFSDINIVGIPARPGIPVSQMVHDIKLTNGKNILVLHASVLEKFEEYLDNIFAPVLKEELIDGFKYIALGHYHNEYQSYKFNGFVAVYPGSPTIVTGNELGVRHVAFVEIDKSVFVEPVELNVPYVEKHTVYVMPDIENKALMKIEQLLKAGKPNLTLQIELRGVCENNGFKSKVDEVVATHRGNLRNVVLNYKIKVKRELRGILQKIVDKLKEKDISTESKVKMLSLMEV